MLVSIETTNYPVVYLPAIYDKREQDTEYKEDPEEDTVQYQGKVVPFIGHHLPVRGHRILLARAGSGHHQLKESADLVQRFLQCHGWTAGQRLLRGFCQFPVHHGSSVGVIVVQRLS